MVKQFSIAISPYLRLKTVLLFKCLGQRARAALISNIRDPKIKTKIFVKIKKQKLKNS